MTDQNTNNTQASASLSDLPDVLKEPSDIIRDYEKLGACLGSVRKAAVAFLKPQLFAIMRAKDIAQITVTFDGSGDDGQIERITAYTASNQERELPTDTMHYVWAEQEWLHGPEDALPLDRAAYRIVPKPVTKPFAEAIEALCYHLLWMTHGGWENNDGVRWVYVRCDL